MTVPGLSDGELAARLRATVRGLVAYATMLTGDADLADEVVQESCLEVWRVRARFDGTGDFGAWVRGIARNVVLRQQRRRGRDRLTPFTAETMEQLEASWGALRGERELEMQRAALSVCVGELGADDRNLLQRRYNDHAALETLARSRGSTVDAVKMTLLRLRKRLRACVEARVRKEESGV